MSGNMISRDVAKTREARGFFAPCYESRGVSIFKSLPGQTFTPIEVAGKSLILEKFPLKGILVGERGLEPP